ncbi:two-component sensor histidine kinase [Paenibacillus albiflavus]|uniref:histidine kinase n=1 Tax=Paenibacillus albiflavus TaxID=2545760 RepID=A0A4R4EEX1_9BACL|nr:HAMP domain-containing sensor histidine kinase [Paenibacillus albiflavus]TCZ76595.1 two-component sensor histidine kinase [Paenibacillus albiflavus]
MSWSKVWKVIVFIGRVMFAVTCIMLVWSLSYWINPYIFKWFGWEITGYWAYLLHGIFSLLLLSMVMALFFPRAIKKHYAFTKKISDALRRISKGDFDVHIQADKDFEREYRGIIEGIHDMAGELGQAEKMKQEFISNVSHEIQSPLTSIRGFARALQENDLTEEERKHYLQIIEMETMRLSKLSDNLMKLTSLESKGQKLEMTSFSLDNQIRTLVLASEPQWSDKDLELELDLQKIMITADEDMLSQVWVNLIHNAIKFTPESGSIAISMKQVGDLAVVSIEDTGIGIDQEHLPRLFERFFKADASRNRALGGNGLGLSIVQKIITLHQGSIGVQSERGHGTKFDIKLPLQSRPLQVDNSVLENK